VICFNKLKIVMD